MDTTYKHIGNLLVNATEEQLHEVLIQYQKKAEMTKEEMLKYFSEVMDCRLFYYDGTMRENFREEQKL